MKTTTASEQHSAADSEARLRQSVTYLASDELEGRGMAVEVLVNNAGFGTHGMFVRTKLEEEVGMIQVNIVALIQLTRLFLPQMVLRKSGKIMNVA